MCALWLCTVFALSSQAQWVRTEGPEGGAVKTLRFDADTLYAGIGDFGPGDIFRSTNFGATWTSIGASIPGNSILNDLAVNANYVFAATRNGLYRTDKGGDVWASISPAQNGLPNPHYAPG